jgi:hypothetical protein
MAKATIVLVHAAFGDARTGSPCTTASAVTGGPAKAQEALAALPTPLDR